MLTGDLLLVIDFTDILPPDLFLLIELKWLMQHIRFTDFGKIRSPSPTLFILK